MAHVNGKQPLGREIKRALSAAGLSVPKAAALMGADRKLLYRWINGDVSPRLVDIDRFGRTIGQPIALTVGDTTKEAPPAEADGAMSAFLRRWESDEPPPWAVTLTGQILEAVSQMNGRAQELHTEAEALREIRKSYNRAARALARGQSISPHDRTVLGIEAMPEPKRAPSRRPKDSTDETTQ